MQVLKENVVLTGNLRGKGVHSGALTISDKPQTPKLPHLAQQFYSVS